MCESLGMLVMDDGWAAIGTGPDIMGGEQLPALLTTYQAEPMVISLSEKWSEDTCIAWIGCSMCCDAVAWPQHCRVPGIPPCAAAVSSDAPQTERHRQSRTHIVPGLLNNMPALFCVFPLPGCPPAGVTPPTACGIIPAAGRLRVLQIPAESD